MTVINITTSCLGPEGSQVWSLLELQGQVLVDDDGLPLDGLDLGTLCFEKGVPILSIGPHKLEGSIEKLNPPLLILVRGDGLDFTVDGIAYQKIIFKERPKLNLRL
jgi:hypothetical protein